jgi:CheY-like chemotaxis protein
MKRPVYVIDDDALARQTLRQFLEARGLTVVATATVAEAMDVLHNDVFRLPSAIISDVRMPSGPSGVSLARNIRGTARFKDVAVMLVSAYDRPSLIPETVPFFSKPLNLAAITDELFSIAGIKKAAAPGRVR